MFELIELLTQVNTQILRSLSPIVKANGISVSEMIILWKINKKGPCKITDLVNSSGLPASTLTSLFDRLEAKELITRKHAVNDRRCIQIQGTTKLKEIIDSVIKESNKELSSMLDTLTPAFIEHLQTDLLTLQQLLLQTTRNIK